MSTLLSYKGLQNINFDRNRLTDGLLTQALFLIPLLNHGVKYSWLLKPDYLLNIGLLFRYRKYVFIGKFQRFFGLQFHYNTAISYLVNMRHYWTLAHTSDYLQPYNWFIRHKLARLNCAESRKFTTELCITFST